MNIKHRVLLCQKRMKLWFTNFLERIKKEQENDIIE